MPGVAVTDAQAAATTPGTTAMGFPSKLSLSVAGGATRMAHAAQPVADGGNVELWHSRLSRRTTSGKLVELPTSITAHRALVQQPTADPALSDAKINSVLDTSVQNAHRRPDDGPARPSREYRRPPGACGFPPWGPGWTPAGAGPASPCRAGATGW